MKAMGVEVEVIAPQDWDEQGKRQVNDKHDALLICRRLSEYLAGHHKALRIVRIPSPEEEARRAQGRLREQLCRQIRRMQAMGRSLLLQRAMAVRGRWWRGRTWEQILAAMPNWVIAQLEIWKGFLELAEKQVRRLEMQLKKWQSTSASLDGGTGLASEPLAALPYRGVLHWGALLGKRKGCTAARKKAIVALARLLAVDLWRIATGRVQAAQLGLLSKEILPIKPTKKLCREENPFSNPFKKPFGTAHPRHGR
jgi:hypothetical protein